MKPSNNIKKWFEGHKGKATAFIFIGNGIGTIVFNQIGSIYINTENIIPEIPYDKAHPYERYFSKDDTKLMNRVPFSYLIIGGSIFLLNLIGLCLMYEKQENPNSQEPESITLKTSDDSVEESKTLLNFKKAIRMPDLYLISIAIGFYTISPAIFGVNYKAFGQRFIKDDKFLNDISSITGIVNLFTRFFWGFVIDKLKFKTVYFIFNISTIILVMTVYLNVYINIKYIYLLWTTLILSLECGILIILPVGISRRFGQKNLVLIYGLVTLLSIPSFIIDSQFSELNNYLGYFAQYAVASGFTAIALVAGVFYDTTISRGPNVEQNSDRQQTSTA